MTFGISATAALAGATAIGGGLAYLGSQNAADAQRDAAAQSAAAQREMTDKSIAAQREMFDIGRTDLAPYREGGVTAQNQLMQLLGIGGNQNAPGYGKYARDFGMEDFTADPGSAFRLKTGLESLERSGAARGMGLSGAALKGITRYGQDYASNEYQNAFNRYQTERAAKLDPLFKLYTGGQSAAAGAATQAGNLGQNLGNTYSNLGTNLGKAATDAGAATAGGYVAGGNAINSTIGSLGNQYMAAQNAANQTSYQNSLLAALNNRGGNSLEQSLLNNPFG